MKQEEINQLSLEDLKDKLDATTEQIVKLTMSHQVSPLENPMQIKSLRRTIARLNTELTKRNTQA